MKQTACVREGVANCLPERVPNAKKEKRVKNLKKSPSFLSFSGWQEKCFSSRLQENGTFCYHPRLPMDIMVAQKQREFFTHRRWIEFERLIPREQIKSFAKLVQKLTKGKDPFSLGRNLWKKHPEVRKFAFSRSLSQVAFGLTGQTPLRLGFDQYLYPGMPWEEAASLDEVCSISGIVAVCLIPLVQNEPCIDDADFSHLFSYALGNVVYITGHKLIDFPLVHLRGSPYYLLAYAKARAQYKLNTNDPMTREWVRLGYSSGDRLNDEDHPVVYR